MGRKEMSDGVGLETHVIVQPEKEIVVAPKRMAEGGPHPA
jgi:hypothetical protein